MTQHTPGPWAWVNGQLVALRPDREGGNLDVLSVADGKSWPFVVILNEADEQLITAAPDLLAACKKLLAVVEDFMPNIGQCVLQDYQRLNEGLIEGKTAIAKAESDTK